MNIKLFPLFASAFLLVSCGGGNNSSAPVDSEDDLSVEETGSETPSEETADAFKVTFVTDEHSSVLVYPCKDYTLDPTAATFAYSVNKDTGELVNDGTGQVNFKVKLDTGYEVDSLGISEDAGYDKLNTPRDTGVELVYQITKISSNLTVNITSKEEGPEEGFTVNFVTSNCEVGVYPGQDYSVEPEVTNVTYTVNPDTGKLSKDPDFAQVNFIVNVAEGYTLDLGIADQADGTKSACVEGQYKNIKSQGAGIYRITKVASDLTITLNAVPQVGEVKGHEVVVNASHATVYLYKGQTVSSDNVADVTDSSGHAVSYSYLSDGSVDTKEGSGQVNFQIVVDDGYELDSTLLPEFDSKGEASASAVSSSFISGPYNKLKLIDADSLVFRLTKVAGPLEINVVTVAK